MQFTMKYQDYSSVCRAVNDHILINSGLPDIYSMRRDIARSMHWSADYHLKHDTMVTIFTDAGSVMYGIIALAWYADQEEKSTEYPTLVKYWRELALEMSEQLDALTSEK